MSYDRDWLETLLKQWASLTSDVRAQLQASPGLAPGDRKNQRRLEKKLKIATCKLEMSCHDPAARKPHA
jgi:hypothetical protein